MSLLTFRIKYPDGRQEALGLEADRALIGSGAHCEIRLPVDQARVEHVLVQLTPTGVFAQAVAFDPPPSINGIPFTQGNLTPDAVLVVGQTEIVVTVEQQAVGQKVVAAKQQKTSPMTIVLALLMVPLAAYVLLSGDEESGVTGPPKEAPALWPASVATCPQTSRDQALAIATDKWAVAEGKRERSPFDVRDGVQAVPLYETAAACFRVAGETKAADEAKAAADQLRKQFTDEYRTHAVWLEHSLRVQDWKSAQREVALMLAFTEGKKGEYVTWLSDLDRQLKVKYGQHSP